MPPVGRRIRGAVRSVFRVGAACRIIAMRFELRSARLQSSKPSGSVAGRADSRSARTRARPNLRSIEPRRHRVVAEVRALCRMCPVSAEFTGTLASQYARKPYTSTMVEVCGGPTLPPFLFPDSANRRRGDRIPARVDRGDRDPFESWSSLNVTAFSRVAPFDGNNREDRRLN